MVTSSGKKKCVYETYEYKDAIKNCKYNIVALRWPPKELLAFPHSGYH